MSEPYHPHWRETRGDLVHIGNFTGPFTACGKPNMGMKWQDNRIVPLTCFDCLAYTLRVL